MAGTSARILRWALLAAVTANVVLVLFVVGVLQADSELRRIQDAGGVPAVIYRAQVPAR